MIAIGRALFSLAFALAGLYLLRVVAALWKVKREYAERGIVTEGEIIAFESRQYGGKYRGSPMMAPVVEFTGPNGARLQFTSSRAERPTPYTVGQRVAVRYLPEDPVGADLDGVARGWFSIVVIFIMIVAAFAVASLPLILPPPVQH